MKKKVGRPKLVTENLKTYTLKIEPNKLKRFLIIAKIRDEMPSHLFRQFVDAYLDKYDKYDF